MLLLFKLRVGRGVRLIDSLLNRQISLKLDRGRAQGQADGYDDEGGVVQEGQANPQEELRSGLLPKAGKKHRFECVRGAGLLAVCVVVE